MGLTPVPITIEKKPDPISNPIRYPTRSDIQMEKRHGQSKKTNRDGTVEEGEWKDDEFIGWKFLECIRMVRLFF